jgi:hypothetical protein
LFGLSDRCRSQHLSATAAGFAFVDPIARAASLPMGPSLARQGGFCVGIRVKSHVSVPT